MLKNHWQRFNKCPFIIPNIPRHQHTQSNHWRLIRKREIRTTNLSIVLTYADFLSPNLSLSILHCVSTWHTPYQVFSNLFERILACYKLHFSSGRYEKYYPRGIHISLLRAGDIAVIFVAVGVIYITALASAKVAIPIPQNRCQKRSYTFYGCFTANAGLWKAIISWLSLIRFA